MKIQVHLCLLALLFTLIFPRYAEAGGTWTALAHTPPGGVNNSLLMSDGTVLAMNGNGQCFRLTPDSHGSYINGTWTTLTAMNSSRLFFASDVLTNGNVFVAGGEYGDANHDDAELYDSLANTWTVVPGSQSPNFNYSDSPSEMLPNGNLLVSDSQSTYYFYNVASNMMVDGGTCGDMNEVCWTKLPNGCIFGADNYGDAAEHFVPSTGAWVVDTNSPPPGFQHGDDQCFLLPNGQVFHLGSQTPTGFYTPGATVTSPGTLVTGPNLPMDATGTNALFGGESPGAMLVNGNILLDLAPNGGGAGGGGPCYFYEYNYLSNTFTQVSAPGGGSTFNSTPYANSMLDLPDGSVLFVGGQNSSSLYVYTPTNAVPLAAGQPAINSITENVDGSYHLTGVGLAGISEGAMYGDDEQMACNYPLVRLTNTVSGNVYYARTYGWNSTTVQNTNLVTTEFSLPPSLPAGTYSLVVSAVGNASAPQTFTYSPPSAPTGLNAAAGNTQVTLSWNSVSGATAYDVLRSTTSGGPYYVPLATVTGTSYTNTGLINGFTNYYVVKAVGSGGPSGYSSQVGVAAIGPPPVPTGLTVPLAGSTLISLSWNASYGATNYNVQRSTTNGGAYATIGTTTGTNYNDTSVISGTNYYYVVSAVGPNGTSSNSLQVTAMALPPPWVTSDIGSVGTVGSTRYSNGIWTVNGSGTAIVGTADQFRYVYQPLNGNCDVRARVSSQQNTDPAAVAGMMIRETLDTGGAFAETYITPGSGFHFKYRPADGSNSPTSITGSGLNSAPNNWVRVTRTNSTFTGYSSANGVSWTQISSTNFSMATNYYVGLVVCAYVSTLATDTFDNVSVTTVPPAPTGLNATGGNTQVSLSWNASSGATSYNVKRSTSSGGEVTVTNVSGTSYIDMGLANGTKYYYEVSALNSSGESANSAEVNATTVPPAPTGLNATGGNTQVSLSWNASSGATSYNVKRSTSSGGEVTVTNVSGTSYIDMGLANGTKYYYEVSALNSSGESANSAEVNATTVPPAPTGLNATGGNTQVSLSWNASSGATSYNVKRSTSSGGEVTVTNVSGTSYIDMGLANGTKYYYEVSALNSSGESANSAEVNATTVPPAPTGLNATGGNTQVSLSWNASSGATSYNVKRSTSSGGEVTVTNVSGTSYIDMGLANGTKYYYEVSALNSSGESANSAEVNATTVPPAPTGLNATGGNTQVSLSWNASSGATSYNVKRSTSSGGEVTVTNVSGTSYIDTGLANGTKYYYEVSALNSSGESANSAEVNATTVPPAPTGLNATGGNTQVSLSWNASSGATSYNVKRSTSSGGEVTVTNVSGTSYIDTGLANGTKYYYEVSALNSSGESANSAEVSVIAGTIVEASTGGASGTDWNQGSQWMGGAVPLNNTNYATYTNTSGSQGIGVYYGVNFGLGRLRTTSGNTNDTFKGGSLTIASGSELLVKNTTGANVSANIVFANYFNNSGYYPLLRLGPSTPGGTVTLSGTITNTVNSYVANDANAVMTFIINSTVAGAGNLTLVSADIGTFSTTRTNLLTGDWSKFAGTLNIGNTNCAAVVELNNSVTTLTNMALMMPNTNGILKLDKALTVKSFKIGANSVASGTYAPNGSGSLTNQSGTLHDGGSFFGNGSLTIMSLAPLSIVAPPPSSPYITSIGLSGTMLTISATNGPTGGTYWLLMSTNMALPLNQWTPVLTNVFDDGGNLNLSTNIVHSGDAQEFYILQVQ